MANAAREAQSDHAGPNQFRQLVESVISAHRSVTHPQHILHLGYRFTVLPGVFSPFLAPSGTLSLAFAALPIFQGKSILDVGCGAGIQACLMALSGASRVVAVDLSPVAVENASINASEFGLTDVIDIRKGQVADCVGANEKFDIVFADLPLFSANPADRLEEAFYDENLSSVRDLADRIPFLLARSPEAAAFICLSNFYMLNIEGQERMGIQNKGVTFRLIRIGGDFGRGPL